MSRFKLVAYFVSQDREVISCTFLSQLRSNQNVKFRGKQTHLKNYFNKINKGEPKQFSIRGGDLIEGTVSSARLHVDAHGKKCFVIALKYEDEKAYRYLVATDMTWRTIDIIQAYTLRWLVEVFFEDWNKRVSRPSHVNIIARGLHNLRLKFDLGK